MHLIKKITFLLLTFLLLPVLAYAAEDSVFIRIDRDDPDAWKEELANVAKVKQFFPMTVSTFFRQR